MDGALSIHHAVTVDEKNIIPPYRVVRARALESHSGEGLIRLLGRRLPEYFRDLLALGNHTCSHE